MKKRVLAVLTRDLSPPLTGRKQVLKQILEFLCDWYDVGILYFSNSSVETGNFPKSARFVRKLEFPSFSEKLLNIFRFNLSRSFQEALFFSKKNLRILKKEVQRFDPDLIYFDMLRTAQYGIYLRKPYIADLDDLHSIRYDIYSKKSASGEEVLGAFSDIVPGCLRFILRSRVGKLVLKTESILLKRREIKASLDSVGAILVSAEEADKLRRRLLPYGAVEVEDVPPAIKMVKTDRSRLVRHSLGFMGYFKYSPNVEAVRYLLEKIYPKIRTIFEDARVFLIGGGEEELSKSYTGSGIHFTGYVENVADELQKIEVFVAPIFMGTGIKTKILIAMSLGIPVVTTPIGAEGIGARNGVEMLIAETEADFVKYINELFTKPELAERIGKAGREFVLNRFSYESVKNRFLNFIDAAIERAKQKETKA